MLIIFQLKPNRIVTYLIIILCGLSQMAAGQSTPKCLQHKFTTPFTQCLIYFEKCSDQPLPQKQVYQEGFRFKNCSMSKCSSFTSGDQCKTTNDFKLEEQQCYTSCCMSKTFNQLQCLSKNEEVKSRTDTLNLYMFIFLGICGLGLLIVIVCFIFKQLKCFDKEKVYKKQSKGPIWRVGKASDLKCNLCHQYGAVIETSCKHYFHIQCYKISNDNKPLKGQCLICDQLSSSYRAWCSQCQQKYIKISFNEIKTIDQLSLHYEQSKFLHEDCMKELNCYIKTDLRLTSASLG